MKNLLFFALLTVALAGLLSAVACAFVDLWWWKWDMAQRTLLCIFAGQCLIIVLVAVQRLRIPLRHAVL